MDNTVQSGFASVAPQMAGFVSLVLTVPTGSTRGVVNGLRPFPTRSDQKSTDSKVIPPTQKTRQSSEKQRACSL